MIFKAEKEAALAQLKKFLPYAGRDYARNRNSDMGQGEHIHVSCLSPYIRHGIISEPAIIADVLEQYSYGAAEKFIQEVCWRSYFKGWLEHNPQIWLHYQTDLKALISQLETDAALKQNYDKAVQGLTDIACFNAWAIELLQTGYLHNHARMWFASIWIFTLKLPWQLGADFFLRHLLDGDPASNTLSWRWVGGLHTKGKTYLARADNIHKFTHGRFNPQGQLASVALPLTEDYIQDERPLSLRSGSLQSRLVPDAEYLLLLHEDDMRAQAIYSPSDLSPMMPPKHAPKAVIGALATTRRSELNISATVQKFVRNMLAESVNDMRLHFGLDGQGELMENIIAQDWAPALIAACRRHNVKAIVTPYMPVGPTAQALEQAYDEIIAAGISITQIRREWDIQIWPYCNRGFFKLKKKIPKILDDLQHASRQGQLL